MPPFPMHISFQIQQHLLSHYTNLEGVTTSQWSRLLFSDRQMGWGDSPPPNEVGKSYMDIRANHIPVKPKEFNSI